MMTDDDFDLNAIRRRKQIKRGVQVLAWIVAPGLAVGLTLYGFSTSINLFLTPAQAKEQASIGQLFRLGGLVVVGSCRKNKQLAIEFDITDGHETLSVHYNGILPDLFREGQGVIATGRLRSETDFEATQLLAKHDETYIPRELIKALENTHNADNIELPSNLSNKALKARAAIMARPKCA